MLSYISLRSVAQALKEHDFWSFCAALSTVAPVAVGPNLRRLPDTDATST